MNKAERLALIRQAAKRRPALSATSAELLEDLQREDPDLGGVASYGECLPADSVRVNKADETEDESEENTELVSPFMRDMQKQEESEIREFEKVEA